jgi:hypothetical protein
MKAIGSETIGSFDIVENTTTNKKTTNIQVLVPRNDPIYSRVVIHEKCHQNQYKQNRLGLGCGPVTILGRFASEFECYIKSDTPFLE